MKVGKLPLPITFYSWSFFSVRFNYKPCYKPVIGWNILSIGLQLFDYILYTFLYLGFSKNVLKLWGLLHYKLGIFVNIRSEPLSRCSNVSTTPIIAMGCRQWLPLSVVQLKGKLGSKPHRRNGVVDTFGWWIIKTLKNGL